MELPLYQEVCRLIDHHSPARIAEQLERFLKPTIRMDSSPASAYSLPLGTSKLGGLPDLPSGLAWPNWEEVPMVFLAQINLQDVTPYDIEQLLPAHGLLYFFCQSQSLFQGFGTKVWDDIDPDEPESWKVFFFDGGIADLQATPPLKGLAQKALLPGCALHFWSALTLPPIWSTRIESLHLTKEEFKQYQNLLTTVEDAFPSAGGQVYHKHRLLGYPFQMQADMQLSCEMASLKIKPIQWTRLDEQAQASIKTAARQWVLLLQIDSDEHAQVMWGEAGSFSYWIKPVDLQKRDFTRCRAIEDSL